jgi:hypothetical protein
MYKQGHAHQDKSFLFYFNDCQYFSDSHTLVYAHVHTHLEHRYLSNIGFNQPN